MWYMKLQYAKQCQHICYQHFLPSQAGVYQPGILAHAYTQFLKHSKEQGVKRKARAELTYRIAFVKKHIITAPYIQNLLQPSFSTVTTGRHWTLEILYRTEVRAREDSRKASMGALVVFTNDHSVFQGDPCRSSRDGKEDKTILSFTLATSSAVSCNMADAFQHHLPCVRHRGERCLVVCVWSEASCLRCIHLNLPCCGDLRKTQADGTVFATVSIIPKKHMRCEWIHWMSRLQLRWLQIKRPICGKPPGNQHLSLWN